MSDKRGGYTGGQPASTTDDLAFMTWMAQKIADLEGERDRARDLAAKLEAQLAQIAALHRPWGVVDECDCDDTSTDEHTDFGDFASCLAPEYMICEACCTSGGDQTADCCGDHFHGGDRPRCATVAILDGES